MISISLTQGKDSQTLLNQKSSTLVVFTRQNKGKETAKNDASKQAKAKSTSILDQKSLNSAILERFQTSIDKGLVTGKREEVVLLRDVQFGPHDNVLFIGLGEVTSLSCENLRTIGALIEQNIESAKLKLTLLDLDTLEIEKQLEDHIQALTEGLLLSNYRFEELKTKKKDEKKAEKSVDTYSLHFLSKKSAKGIETAVDSALVLAEAVNFSRRLGDMPGNLMTPTILANSAVAAAKGTRLKVSIWDKARIKKERMGGLLGVSEGSSQDPRFIIMEYKGAGTSKKPVIFVGKGLTFDCGGISIKPSAGMEEMKYDMCGGANVIGTLLAIAKLNLKINVIGLVPSTENLAGPAATKPGDVHYARNGKSFEINNTDAEGRLILADALCYASELAPQAIIDAATLTGAMVVALGNTHTGYFTRNKTLRNQVEGAAEVSGELVWNMPLCDHHVKDMKGTFADLSNMSSSKGAGSATAAAFLEQFVGEGIPWAHFDIAGTGWSVGNRLNYCSKKGASGVMIRTFVELAKDLGK